jgi:hypothetical protein
MMVAYDIYDQLFRKSNFEAWVGLGLTIGGAIDFLFINGSTEGWIASEVYGDTGEELWTFRSFALMLGGPLLILYTILFD